MIRLVFPFCLALCLWFLPDAASETKQSIQKDELAKAKNLLGEIRKIDGHQAFQIDNSQVVVRTPAIKGLVDSGMDSIDVLILAMKDTSIDFDTFVRCYSACDQIIRQRDAKLVVSWYGGCEVKRIQGEQRFFPGGQANDKTFRESVVADVAKKQSMLKSKNREEKTRVPALVGPFPLDSLFAKVRNKDKVLKWMALEKWPSEQSIQGALKKTRIWVRDSGRIVAGKMTLTFDDQPGILIEGPLSFDVKNDEGTNVFLSIMEVEIADTGWGKNNSTRRMRIVVSLRGHRDDARAPGIINMFSDFLIWDSSGAIVNEAKSPLSPPNR